MQLLLQRHAQTTILLYLILRWSKCLQHILKKLLEIVELCSLVCLVSQRQKINYGILTFGSVTS